MFIVSRDKFLKKIEEAEKKGLIDLYELRETAIKRQKRVESVLLKLSRNKDNQ